MNLSHTLFYLPRVQLLTNILKPHLSPRFTSKVICRLRFENLLHSTWHLSLANGNCKKAQKEQDRSTQPVSLLLLPLKNSRCTNHHHGANMEPTNVPRVLSTHRLKVMITNRDKFLNCDSVLAGRGPHFSVSAS